MFYGCTSLISFPDISNWNTINASNISYIFSRCISLKSLPDISKWKTSNVKDMSYMFSDNSSLIYLPNISNWNINNVENISFMFSFCTSLISLPDLSNWNTNNINNMKSMFLGCSSLKSLPDISNWSTSKVKDMSFMFSRCSSLKSLSDISNWDTNKVTNMKCMFTADKSLITFPDISSWNTNNVEDMSYMFSNCTSLTSLPDISKWNPNKANDIFYNCSSLKALPDISNWNTKNDIKRKILPVIKRKYDYLFKLLIVGDSGVGKTNLLLRFTDDSFTSHLITIGIDFKIKIVNIENTLIKLQIWDTAGVERFRTITRTYYKGAHGIILVYDASYQSSFKNIHNWIKEIEENVQPNVPKILVATKCDKPDRKVTEEEGKKLACDFGMPFFETSAKINQNVYEIFIYLANEILEVKRRESKI